MEVKYRNKKLIHDLFSKIRLHRRRELPFSALIRRACLLYREGIAPSDVCHNGFTVFHNKYQDSLFNRILNLVAIMFSKVIIYSVLLLVALFIIKPGQAQNIIFVSDNEWRLDKRSMETLKLVEHGKSIEANRIFQLKMSIFHELSQLDSFQKSSVDFESLGMFIINFSDIKEIEEHQIEITFGNTKKSLVAEKILIDKKLILVSNYIWKNLEVKAFLPNYENNHHQTRGSKEDTLSRVLSFRNLRIGRDKIGYAELSSSYSNVWGYYEKQEEYFSMRSPIPEDFYWTPVKPTISNMGSRKNFEQVKTLDEVSEELSFALNRSGYQDLTYYGTPDMGFVITTAPEAIRPNGKAFEGDNRFLPKTSAYIRIREELDGMDNNWFQIVGKNIIAYSKAATSRSDAYYRMVCVSVRRKNNFQEDNPDFRDKGQFAEFHQTGKNYLISEIGNLEFSDEYSVCLLVYEFFMDHNKGNKVNLLLHPENSRDNRKKTHIPDPMNDDMLTPLFQLMDVKR
ncbi:MAG: hypothetical protein MRZ79_07575 [Bacteroidia bacterium]|nr:hypothetical protein [Bacteroidia bacterium]